MSERKLAHIEKITDLQPIPGYDRVVYATVLGWKTIVGKDEFKIGDWCVYFEIDSKLPEAKWSEFLRKKHFKVKTQKMCKVISQGLALPLESFASQRIVTVPDDSGKPTEAVFSFLPEWAMNPHEGDDVTHILGVTYSIAEDNVRKAKTVDPNVKYKSMAARHPELFKKPLIRKLMKKTWGRKILFALFGKKKDKPKSFPTHFPFVHKTDEERVENIPWILENEEPWIVTTKIDGTSSTYILERKKRKKFEFYVLSRNVRQLNPDQETYHENNVYWDMEKKYHIRDFLQSQLDKNPKLSYVCLQGETAGVGVQGNPHKLKDTEFFGFNYIDSENGRWNSIRAKELCESYNIQWVPIIDSYFLLPNTMEEIKQHAEGPCDIPGSSGLREGFVYRSFDGKRSFKNVSRTYLLKHNQ